MHIPDGYLSPQTCAALYAASAPFWYAALRRLRRSLSTQFLPLVSIVAAFSFVVMMFNLPLPGGTTGHATGIGVASVVLGPWASIVAISTALVIQAIFFGDGGITAIGANCFNMAIVGSLAAWATYRICSRNAPHTSRRRVLAAALGGYIGINLAALCAAIEFGIQPGLFHDSAGAPLYCPYPLSISVPAMMLGHLTFAGLAELVITAGVVAYLQRAEPALLTPLAGPETTGASRRLRPFWVTLAVLAVLTPLGILAVGSAWGEWSVADFGNLETRRAIAAASGNHLPPATAPEGLARLSSLWTAPVARYAPGFVPGPSLAYIVSALLGIGAIALLFVLARLVLSRWPGRRQSLQPGFIQRTLKSLLDAVEYALFAEEIAHRKGWLQSLDPRVKVAGIACFLMAATTTHSLAAVAAVFAIGAASALSSRIPIRTLLTHVWVPALVFSGPIALPAAFLTGGVLLARLPVMGWAVTVPGLKTCALLLLRVEAAATLSALLVFTTEWARVLRALRFFRIPVAAVVILGMTYRYIFLLLKTARDMFEARQSRLVGTLAPDERRRLAGASAGVLLSKSFQLSTDVHAAMRSRGFHGEIYLLDHFVLLRRDWLYLSMFAAAALAVGLLL